MLPPREESSYFDQAKKAYEDCQSRFRSLGADVVEEKDVESWTHDRLGKDFAALVSHS